MCRSVERVPLFPFFLIIFVISLECERGGNYGRRAVYLTFEIKDRVIVSCSDTICRVWL